MTCFDRLSTTALSSAVRATLIAVPLVMLGFGAEPVFAQPRQLGPPPGMDLEGANEPEGAPPVQEKKPEKFIDPLDEATTAAKNAAKEAAKAKERAKMTTPAPEILDIPLDQIPNYRGRMRDIVEEMSRYARSRDSKFVVLARPGFDLLSWGQREFDLEELQRDPNKAAAPDTIRPVGMPMRRYYQAINGFVLNGQFCSPLRIPHAELAAARGEGLKALTIEHCANEGAVASALQKATSEGMIGFADTAKDNAFASVPRRRPFPENPANIETLSAAKNALLLFSSKSFGSRADWLTAMGNNNYDMLVIDAFDRTDQPLTKSEVYALKFKQMGARRLVLARLDIGNADDSRFYWQKDWQVGAPSWIQGMVPDAQGQYVVEFWNPAWKAIVGKYFAGIMDLGFDGVMLDGVEAYRRWEAKTPISNK